jgi:hypothetical protein
MLSLMGRTEHCQPVLEFTHAYWGSDGDATVAALVPGDGPQSTHEFRTIVAGEQAFAVIPPAVVLEV